MDGKYGTDIKEIKNGTPLEYVDELVRKGLTYEYEIRSFDEDWLLSKPLSLTLKMK